MALLDQEFNETERGQQSKEVMKQAPLVLVMFDFDHFKQYNDNYGHPAGDVMLKKVARIAQRCFRDSDTIARIGGDEFAVLLPRTRATEAMIPTERLRSTVEKELGKNGVTVTIGFSDIADFMKRSKDLYNTVDKFLYKAKKAGKNQTWHPLRDAVKKVNL